MGKKWNDFKKKFGQGAKKTYTEAQKVAQVMGPRMGDVNAVTDRVFGIPSNMSNQPARIEQPKQNLPSNQQFATEQTLEGFRNPPTPELISSPWDPEFFNPMNNSYKKTVGTARPHGWHEGVLKRNNLNSRDRKRRVTVIVD